MQQTHKLNQASQDPHQLAAIFIMKSYSQGTREKCLKNHIVDKYEINLHT